MASGVTASRVHLNRLDTMHPEFASELETLDPMTGVHNEIDWAVLEAFNGGQAFTFAGRYFAGAPTQQDVDNDEGFCLWAHGEGFGSGVPTKIVPLHRGDPFRLTAPDLQAQKFGAEDGYAMGRYLSRCLTVGDLVLPSLIPWVLVFLEVPPGTALSFGYWRHWASSLNAIAVDPDPHDAATLARVQPFMPAIACGFEPDDDSSVHVPEQAIRDCLNTEPAPPGNGHRCRGFWSLTPLAATELGTFTPRSEVFPVPVYYYRTFDPDVNTLPVGSADVTQSLALVTLDETNPNIEEMGESDATRFALNAVPWNPSADLPFFASFDDPTTPENEDQFVANTEASLLSVRPTQLGIDTAAFLKNGVAHDVVHKLNTDDGLRPIVVARLPAGFDYRTPSGVSTAAFDNGTHIDIASDPNVGPVTASASFTGRYLRPHFNGLRTDEVDEIVASGMQVCCFFQIGINVAGKGMDHGEKAFNSAHTLRQPPYTPIYFAVDASVDGPVIDRGPQPTFSEAFTYFRDIRKAYMQYISSGDKTPYYIGCYGSSKILSAIYRAGLATHFWQLWAPTYGAPVNRPRDWSKRCAGWRAWPHLNVWQVIIDATDSSLYNVWNDNDVQGIVGVDLNVAWGDPGSWEEGFEPVPLPAPPEEFLADLPDPGDPPALPGDETVVS